MSRPSRTASARPFPLVAALLAGLLFLGCADEDHTPTAPGSEARLADGLSSGVGPPQDLGPALAAQKRHSGRLMARDDVVGTAVGLNDAGEPALVVYALRPAAPGLPDRLDDVPLETVVTGLIVAGSDPTTRARPAPVGFSVSHPDVTAGTIGARLTDGAGGVFVLSNNHILADVNQANLGDSALQPGSFDGGTDPEDRIGELVDFEPIDFSGENTIDAAIASTTTENVGSATPTDDGYGQPGTTLFALDGDGDGNVDAEVVGLNVQKYGRTTKLTQGQVEEISVTVEVCFETRGPFQCAASATFVDQISISPGSFSDGGDSGSLIVTDDSNASPVGLLFAGSDTRTLANRIDLVLDRFGLAIDDGSGDSGGGGDDGTGDTNSAPTADFTASCTDLTCDFDGSGSSDSDGSIASFDWDFGDGSTGTGETVSHTYDAGGTFTVTLTVTDDDGATDSQSQDVTVEEPASGDLTLSATGQKVRGVRTVDLAWSGASSTNVDVFRNGSLVTTTANDGEYTDDLGRGGGGSFTYQVCEAGTSTCSNEATVTF